MEHLSSILRSFLRGRVIFVSVVGSEAWRMSTTNSDVDVFAIRVDPIDEVLSRGPSEKGKFTVIEGERRVDLTGC